MIADQLLQRENSHPAENNVAAMIAYLRHLICGEGFHHAERFHAVFLDSRNAYLGDTACGDGNGSSLSLRMRELFGRALAVGASSLIVAHNHPSGLCRPSQRDIEATRRLGEIARALDIELLDHLIFTQSAVYSMRAGGKL